MGATQLNATTDKLQRAWLRLWIRLAGGGKQKKRRSPTETYMLLGSVTWVSFGRGNLVFKMILLLIPSLGFQPKPYKGQKHSITSNYNFTISDPSTMECIYPVLDVEQLLNGTSVDPSRINGILQKGRASGKKAQASSKEDSLQTCQIKNQIKPLLMLKKSDQSTTTHIFKMYLYI